MPAAGDSGPTGRLPAAARRLDRHGRVHSPRETPKAGAAAERARRSDVPPRSEVAGRRAVGFAYVPWSQSLRPASPIGRRQGDGGQNLAR